MTEPRASSEGVRRVAAAVLVRDGRLLLCLRRGDSSWYPGVWDLPGGHVEPEEGSEQALVRECREELDVEVVRIGERWTTRTGGAHLTLCRIDEWRGEPVNAEPHEHQKIGWFTSEEVRGLRLSDPRLEELAKAVTASSSRPRWP